VTWNSMVCLEVETQAIVTAFSTAGPPRQLWDIKSDAPR